MFIGWRAVIWKQYAVDEMQIFWSRERKFCSEIELEFANLFETKRHWSVYKAEYFIILGVNPSACPSVKYHLGGLLLGAISGSFLCVFACFFFLSYTYLLFAISCFIQRQRHQNTTNNSLGGFVLPSSFLLFLQISWYVCNHCHPLTS